MKILKGLAKFGIGIIACCMLAGEMTPYMPILGLFTHFSLHYFLCLILALPFVTSKQRPFWFLVASFLILIHAVKIATDYLTSNYDITTTGSYTLMTFNLEKDIPKPTLVLPFLKDQQPDILVLHEYTPGWHQRLSALQKLYPYRHFVLNEGYFGQLIASKYPFESVKAHWLGSCDSPALNSQINVDGLRLDLWALHPPSPPRLRDILFRDMMMDSLAQMVAGNANPLMVVGDLNITPFHPHFSSFVEKAGLMDSRLGKGYQASWPSGLGALGIPLDHICHNEAVDILTRTVGPKKGSDHLPVMIRWSFHGK